MQCEIKHRQSLISQQNGDLRSLAAGSSFDQKPVSPKSRNHFKTENFLSNSQYTGIKFCFKILTSSSPLWTSSLQTPIQAEFNFYIPFISKF